MNEFSWALFQRPRVWLPSRPVDDLGDQVAVGCLADERTEDDPVGAPVGVGDDVGVLAVARCERGRTGGLDRRVRRSSVRSPSAAAASSMTVQSWATESSCSVSSTPRRYSVERLDRIGVAGQVADVQRVGADRVLRRLRVVGGDVVLDRTEVLERRVELELPDVVAVLLGEDLRVGRLHRHPRDRRPTALPVREPAVVVLERLESLDVGVDLCVEFGRVGQPCGVERVEHVAQRRDRHDP